MENASIPLEITVLSAEELQINGKLIKKKTFVIVKTDPINSISTSTVSDGSSYPSWNEKLVINVPVHARFITVEVHCKTSGDGGKLIGTANIPVSEFMGGNMPDNYLHFLSYRLRDRYGQRNGIINLSVKLNSKVSRDVQRSNVTKYACSSSRVVGYGLGVPVGQGHLGGVVIGVPVWSPQIA